MLENESAAWFQALETCGLAGGGGEATSPHGVEVPPQGSPLRAEFMAAVSPAEEEGFGG